MIGLELECFCLGCRRPMPLPEPHTADRVLDEPEGQDIYADVPDPCPQCGSRTRTIRILLEGHE